jgi:threonine dehydrogenase-like Zn-dependent dehydrogenase
MLHRRRDLGAIVTHRRPLAEGPDAYDLFDRQAGGCIQVAFDP